MLSAARQRFSSIWKRKNPFQKHRIAFLLDLARRDVDVERLRWLGGLIKVHVITSPELAREVLVEQGDAFVKGYGLSVFARPMLGDGLLTSERDFHKKQRRMMAPAFVQKRIGEYAAVIAARTESAQAPLVDGDVIDVSATAMRLTLEIVGATLFGAEVGPEADEISAALTAAMEHATRALQAAIPIPPTWPTPANRRGLKAVARLDRTVYGLINERRRTKIDRGDFLSMLLLAQDEDDGGRMTDKQVRDEAMNIFLAGHETTANALAWTFYLLARSPDVRAQLEAEVDGVLGGRTPTLEDTRALPFSMAVLKEAMRLYPPAYVVARRATRAVKLPTPGGGVYDVAKNELCMINIIGIHHRAALFPDPERFDPTRFLADREKELAKQAYLPFGAGARVCIGNNFALLEGQLAIATLAQRVRFDLPDDAPAVEMDPLITLRPRGGVPMRVSRRVAAS